MNKKVLLVYPEFPDTFWSFRDSLKFVNKKANFPPLGLITVAGMLPENYQLKLIDMNVSSLKERDILDSDIVFISAMVIQKESFKKVVSLCNQLNRPVVAGGPYPTVYKQSIEGVDHFVLDEAEVTLPQFLKDYENGTPKKIYASELKPDIRLAPIPRFDLLEMKKYSSMSVQYSRGCPHNCEFCDIIELFGRIPRTKSPEQFIAELEYLYQQGFRGSVFIVDDNFIGNKTEVKKLLPIVIEWQKNHHFPYVFFTEATISLAQDEELMDLMVNAGFNMVFLGIETPVEASLKESGKYQNMKLQLLESVKKIQNKGLEVSSGFIIGFDNDPENIDEIQIDFIQNAGIPTAMVSLLSAVPPTRLYRRLEAEKRLLKETSGDNTFELELTFEPKMGKEKILKKYINVLKTIYNPKEYFQRCLTLLGNLPSKYNFATRSPNPSNVINGLMAFIRSMVKQGFSYYGFEYWKFLIKALIKKPTLFQLTVKMAIFGHHFFNITREKIVNQEREVRSLKIFFLNLIHRFQRKLSETFAIRHLSGGTSCLEKYTRELFAFCKRILPEIEKALINSSSYTIHSIEGYYNKLKEVTSKYISSLLSGLYKNIHLINIKKLEKALLKLKSFDSVRNITLPKAENNLLYETYQSIERLIKQLEEMLYDRMNSEKSSI